MTGEGKSQLLAYYFATCAGQRLLVDVQDHYTLGPAAGADGGVLEVNSVEAIDWRVRTIRYVPRSGARMEFDRLYRAVYGQGKVLVWADELEDVAPVNGVPPFVRKVLKQGRKRGLTHLGATQRPAGVERSAYNQAEHLFLFRMVDGADIQALSYRVGLSARELADDLRDLPQHGFLYHGVDSPRIARFEPLPAERIAAAERHVRIPD